LSASKIIDFFLNLERSRLLLRYPFRCCR